MKSKTLKHAMWGAIVAGAIHLALGIYMLKEGGDTAMGLFAIDLPLYLLAEHSKLVGRLSSSLFYYVIFGTLMYAFLGFIFVIILKKIDKFCEKIR